MRCDEEACLCFCQHSTLCLTTSTSTSPGTWRRRTPRKSWLFHNMTFPTLPYLHLTSISVLPTALLLIRRTLQCHTNRRNTPLYPSPRGSGSLKIPEVGLKSNPNRTPSTRLLSLPVPHRAVFASLGEIDFEAGCKWPSQKIGGNVSCSTWLRQRHHRGSMHIRQHGEPCEASAVGFIHHRGLLEVAS